MNEGLFLRACRRKKTERTPIWLMRQAGRYMKEYRDLRQKYDFLTLCKDSALAAQITVDAAERLDVDAAIIFSDILLLLEPMGLGLKYTKDDGPCIPTPVRTDQDVRRLKAVDPLASLGFVMEALKLSRRALKPSVALIGFSAAPFTLASYMIEGGGSKHFLETKTFYQRSPKAWESLMTRISDNLIRYLLAQIAAGAQAVQLFDSWAGALSADDYRRFALPWTRRVIRGLKGKALTIHFSTGTAGYVELLKEAESDVISLDWRTNLGDAWKRLGSRVAIQGNLDPAALLADLPYIRKETRRILDEVDGRPGHIFNLGHGVLPQTPVDHVKALVDYVHETSAKGQR